MLRRLQISLAGLLIVFCTLSSASAQPTGIVRGRVADARTGAPLARVQVRVEGGPEALTDDQGRFELGGLPLGPATLTVSVVGYALVRKTVDIGATPVDVQIPLTEGSGTYAETVTVTGDVFRRGERGAPAQQTLGPADLQNLRGVLADDPLRAVQVLPGVATGDDLRSEFSVRGSDFSRLNMTIEGFATPFVLHTVRGVEDHAASGSVAMINSDILDEVALLNGGYTQRHGNRTGAELDFRLREGSRDGVHTRVAVSGTSASLVGEGPLARKRGSWLVSARKSYLDMLIDRITDDGLAFGFADAQAKFVLDATDTDRLELTLIGGASKLEEPRDELDTNDLFTGKNRSLIGIATWRRTYSRGYATTRLMTAANTFRNETIERLRLDEGDDRQLALRSDIGWTASPRLQLESGVQIEHASQSRTRRRAVTLTTFRDINQFAADGVRTGAYAQLRWDAGRGVSLVPGMRADHWTLTDDATASPWLQVEWRATASTTLRAAGGVYQQFPEFERVVGAFGRADTPPERAAHVDVSVEHRLGAHTRLVVAGFTREEWRMARRPGAETRIVNGTLVRGSATARYVSSLDGHARGFEVLLEQRDLNGLSGWIAYSLSTNRYRDRTTGEAFDGDLDQRHALNVYAIQRFGPRFSLSAKLRAGTNTPAPGYFIARDDRYFVSDRRNELRLPQYARVDVRANHTFTWARRRLTLFAEVINVLDRENVRYNPPSINTQTREARRLFESMLPVVPSAGVLIEF